MRRNAAELRDAAAGAGVDLGIYFARKANKALTFVDAAWRLGLGVDLASERELAQVLERGIPGSALVMTAAVKPAALLERCIASGTTVVVDNADELALLGGLTTGQARAASVALRLAPAARRGPPADALRLRARRGDRDRRCVLVADAGRNDDRRRPLPPRRLRRPRPRHGHRQAIELVDELREPRPRARVRRHRRRDPDELPRVRHGVGAVLERAPSRRCSASARR